MKGLRILDSPDLGVHVQPVLGGALLRSRHHANRCTRARKDDALQKPKASYADDFQLGPALCRQLGHQLHRRGHRQDGLAVELMVQQIEVV